MPAVPVLPTITGGVATTSELTAIVAAVSFLQTPPIAELRQTIGQSIANNAFTAITFDTKDKDSAGGWSSGANTRYTAQYPGWYLGGGIGAFPANATGQRGVAWSINGSTINPAAPFLQPTASGGMNLPSSPQLFFLNIGDFVEFKVFQSSGGALTTVVTGSNQSSMSLLWVSS